MGPSAAERTNGRWAGEPVGAEPGPALKTAQCLIHVRAEDAVEGPGGKTVPGELELERGDVPAAVPAVHHPVAEAMSRVAAERPPGLRARDPVDGDSGAALQRAHAAPRSRAHDPVDRASVEPARLQPDLKGGDVGGPASTRIGDKREQPDEREQRNACSESHGQLSFAPERDYPRPR